MKKTFGYFAAVWAICIAVFNVICFATPRYIAGMDKFAGSFWVGYAFITVAFLGQLACAFVSFRTENLQKMFYNLPLLTISYAGLVAMLVIGSLVMVLPNLPGWLGAVICLLVLVFSVVSILKASAAAEAVNDIDKKIKDKTQFIKMLTVDAQNLLTRAKTDEAKEACRKVYEAARYSDPMSSDGLESIENEISVKMRVLADLVQYGGNIADCADEVIILIGDRNRMCKALK